MRREARHLACLAIIGLGIGCGDGGSSGPAIPLADLPPRLANVLCTTYRNCVGPIFQWFMNGSDCVSVTEQRIRNGTFALIQGEIDAGKVVYTPAKVQACIDSLAARTCAQLLDRDSEACLAALDGKVELGGACTLDEDCKGKAICKSSTGTCPGQCSPLLAAGQACSQDSECQDGLQCSSETKQCVQPVGAGQACEYGSPPCGPGFLCLGKDDSKKTPGTCKTPTEAFSSAPGSACNPSTGLLCQDGSACVADKVSLAPVSIDWVCVANGTYAAGADCKPGFPDACASGTYCKTGTGLTALSGTCTSMPGAGQACVSNGTLQCQPGAVCVSGTCQNFAANGVSCTGDAMCYSENCGPSGGCEAKLPCK
jgi:hypothetical protein